ncbi:MAG: cobyric acid synthase [bacterium]
MSAKTIMIQGTGSGVGKSILVTALCRIFRQDGYKVAPFKAQNMALNSGVTKDGKEMGRAQITQAQACGIDPVIEMNPILIKPTSDIGAQIILLGKPIGNMNAQEYYKYKPKLIEAVKESLNSLMFQYEVVVIEGAGSPAEINLKEHDLVNMNLAQRVDTPVILVVDIDKGGAFAWIVGTLELLNEQERERVKGFIINKFRGDEKLLKPGIDFIEQRCKKPVLGIIPYFKNIKIDEEDSVCLEMSNAKYQMPNTKLSITVIHLPHISNFTDFDVLEREKDVSLKYVKPGDSLGKPDLIIIPGTKNTIDDLCCLKKTNLADKIISLLATSYTLLIGICGGYQMLGQSVEDPYGIESSKKQIDGLGLLNIKTTLEKTKTTFQVKAELETDVFNLGNLKMEGYEIHAGNTLLLDDTQPLFRIIMRGEKKVDILDGAISKDCKIMGTYIHGLFDNDSFRYALLNYLRSKKGLKLISQTDRFNAKQIREKEYDKLADLVREKLDMKKIYDILAV